MSAVCLPTDAHILCIPWCFYRRPVMLPPDSDCSPVCQASAFSCLVRNSAPLLLAPLGGFGSFLLAYKHAIFFLSFLRKKTQNTLTPFPQPVTTHVSVLLHSKTMGRILHAPCLQFLSSHTSRTHSPNLVSTADSLSP